MNNRKYILDIINFCYSYGTFYEIISGIIIRHVRKLVFDKFFEKKKEVYIKIYQIFNKYQYLRNYFQKWKCINQLLLFKNEIQIY